MKQKTAEHYLKVYCTYHDADALNRELAVLGPHTIGRLVDHSGEIPQGSGFFHDTLIGRIDKMRRVHPDFTRSRELVDMLTEDQKYCCVALYFLKKRRPAGAEKPLTTGKLIAGYLGCDYRWFNSQKCRGIDRINAELGFVVA